MSHKNSISHEQFLERAYKIHGDLYDYSKSKYVLSKLKIIVICKKHGDFLISPNNHLRGRGCPKCKWDKMTHTISVKNEKDPNRKNSIIEKRIKTNLEKYGVEHYQLLDSVQLKSRQTCLQKYGVEFTSQVNEFKEKRFETNIEKYGYRNNLQNETCKIKSKETCIEKYGVNNPAQSEEVKEKIRNTNLEKYGHYCSLGSEIINLKKIKTNFQRYGSYSIFSLQEFKERLPLIKINLSDEETNKKFNKFLNMKNSLKDIDFIFSTIKKYNDDIEYVSKLLNIPQRLILKTINANKIQIAKSRYKKVSTISINWLEEIMQKTGIFIQHGQNGKEFVIPGTKYRADGYCKELNTIFEFYGDYFHGNLNVFPEEKICVGGKTASELNERTFIRENFIKQLGFNVISIWERDYLLSKT